MKKLLWLLMLMPVWAIGQEKNIIFTAKMLPKTDKIVEFEKALANHHVKYHTGDWNAIVFEVLSGPDAGSYQITMGPHSWEDFDNRKPTAEHDMDWNANVMPLVEKSTSVGFAVYDKDLSTIAVGDFVEKITIFHVFPKEGKMSAAGNMIKRARASWVANNQSVAVYNLESSGEEQFAMVTRHKTGWKEKGEKPTKSFKDSLGGEGEFQDFMSDVEKNINRTYEEMLIMRKDLGSK